ncbi:hypothetical protein RRSL_02567 [Ralstonia solanacearum UW551]|uniref:Uncharacterized protein n=1 Tax=Ralstonia solanacearum (strain UW551) TaxID=342110 RepID=A0AB33VCC5_RALSU|nr:hypothetical protein RRSL_02567 [Ralstonia solanacearum UW551]
MPATRRPAAVTPHHRPGPLAPAATGRWPMEPRDHASPSHAFDAAATRSARSAAAPCFRVKGATLRAVHPAFAPHLPMPAAALPATARAERAFTAPDRSAIPACKGGNCGTEPCTLERCDTARGRPSQSDQR